MSTWRTKLRHAWKRLKGINIKIRKRRAKGQKTPELAAIRRKLRKKIKYLEEHPPKRVSVKGLKTIDGKQAPAWIVDQVLLPARNSGTWDGYVISGYRTPAYSEQLCYQICGRPSCSGTCAGRATNHACPPDGVAEPHKGAVDVSDPDGLQRWCRAHGNPLHGNGEMLPNDIWHFSSSGR